MVGWVVCPEQSAVLKCPGWGLLRLTMLSPGFPQHQPCATAAFPPLIDPYLFVPLCLHRLF